MNTPRTTGRDANRSRPYQAKAENGRSCWVGWRHHLSGHAADVLSPAHSVRQISRVPDARLQLRRLDVLELLTNWRGLARTEADGSSVFHLVFLTYNATGLAAKVAVSDLYRLLLGVLCVWRLTHLLQAEDGPWDLVVRLRRAAGDGFSGRLLDCFYCLSLWIAVPIAWAIGWSVTDSVLLCLAFSGGAILLERATSAPPTAQSDARVAQTTYEED